MRPITDPAVVSEFRSLVGSLMFLTIAVRADLAYSVGFLSRYMCKPNELLLGLGKRILRYCKGSKNLGLKYNYGNTDGLHGYCDADWGGEVAGRRSTTGYCYMLSGGAVAWRSKLQASVAKSTMEAEYMALSHAVSECVYLKSLAAHLQYFVDGPVMIFEHNQGCIDIALSTTTNPKTKHIEIHFHYVRELINTSQVSVTHKPGGDMVADILTKPLGKLLFQKHVKVLMNFE